MIIVKNTISKWLKENLDYTNIYKGMNICIK